VLRHKIPLSIEEKAPTFLTIENYVDMEELFWQYDHHNYVHEECRVDLSALLKMHCYTWRCAIAADAMQKMCSNAGRICRFLSVC
jgi:hypothetical protein